MTARSTPKDPSPRRLALRQLQAWGLGAWALGSGLGLTGCATPARQHADSMPGTPRWSGRLSLQIDSEPPQNFVTGFELSGQPLHGELHLISPLGSTLAVVRWNASGAEWQRGQDTRQYPDLPSLTEALTGTAVPLDALFDWLQGRPTALPGWEVDLSRHAEGRLQARRTQPEPTAQLRLVFE